MDTTRNHRFVSCIQEMEETEEILKEKWRQIKISGALHDKSSLENLFKKLKERQCLTSAALQALDTYDRLKGERYEYRDREENVLRIFGEWLAIEEETGSSGVESDLEEDEKEAMHTYAQLQKLSRIFAKKWTTIERADKKVARELRNLNISLCSFPRRLGAMNQSEFKKVKWPITQCKRVSAAVEFAFDQIEFVTKLLTKIDDKLDKLEVHFKINKNNILIEPRGVVEAEEEESDQVEEEMDQGLHRKRTSFHEHKFS